MKDRMIRKDGVEIATEAFGDRADPPLLLIMGAMASMLWWPDPFCRKLAARGRYAIRYDHRDTGLSTKYPPGEAPYTLNDFADDALRVLDGYAIPAAHIVGMSIGGMIGQILAIRNPSRVLSLTAISSTPIGGSHAPLPPSTEAFMEHVAEEVDWSDRDQVMEYMVKDARVLAGTAHPFDEKEFRTFVERDYTRSGGYLNATNHGSLMGGDERQGKVSQITAPLLVIHGTADPVFPMEHGAALAAAVPGARLVRLEGGGHELHRDDWNEIIDAIIASQGTGSSRF